MFQFESWKPKEYLYSVRLIIRLQGKILQRLVTKVFKNGEECLYYSSMKCIALQEIRLKYLKEWSKIKTSESYTFTTQTHVT